MTQGPQHDEISYNTNVDYKSKNSTLAKMDTLEFVERREGEGRDLRRWIGGPTVAQGEWYKQTEGNPISRYNK